MADVTVAQFAEVLKVPVDRLLQQLDQAGIKVDSAEDMISEDAKHELLTHLRRSHGHDDIQADAAPRKITLRRKSQSELKLASPQGRARTVNVEVRSKRTYVKREVLEDQARHQQEEIDKQRESEEQAKAALERAENERLEKERLDRERLEEESRRRTDEEVRKRTAEEEARRVAEVQAREVAERERKAAAAKPGAAHRRRREFAAQEKEIARRAPPFRRRRLGYQAWLRDADRARHPRSGDPRGDDGG
jgi:translation initiation factor IF-2